MLEVHQFPCLSDNYGFLLHDPASGETACIDTPDADAYLREAEARGRRITQIWNTHCHPDHAGGNEAIMAATGCIVIAPKVDASKIAAVDLSARVIDVGRRTIGHIAYHLPDAGLACVGGSLFALSCGRMFEGTASLFWARLSRLEALPDDTTIYCAHEYSDANARFALHA